MFENDPFIMGITYGTDFADHAMRHVYHFSEWARLKRLGLPTLGVRITNYGSDDTYIPDKDIMNFIYSQRIHPVWMDE